MPHFVGAYEKRVQDLEQFAQDKNYDYLSVERDDRYDSYDYDYYENQLRKRRLGPRRRKGGGGHQKNKKHQNQASPMSHFYEKEGVYDYVDPLSLSDIFSASSNTAEDKYDTLYEDYYVPQQSQSLTRRVANAIFNPTLFAIVAIPLIIAASYWLFVVNGPTPVVKARIEEEVPNLENEENNWPEIAYRLLKTYFFEVVTKET